MHVRTLYNNNISAATFDFYLSKFNAQKSVVCNHHISGEI